MAQSDDVSAMDLIRQALAPSSQDKSLRDSYEKRLGTFTPLTYFAKPPSLSPLICARLGFDNVGVSMLQCTACHAALEIEIPNALSRVAQRDLTIQLEEQLRAVHGQACPFRHDAEYHLQQEADDDELVPLLLAQVFPTETMDLLDPPRPLSVVCRRWKQMLASLETGGLLGLKLPRQLVEFRNDDNPLSQDMLSSVVEVLQKEENMSNSEATREKEALALVILGWVPVTDDDEHFQCQCSICWSRLSLVTPEDTPTVSTEGTPPAAKRTRTQAPVVDPIQGHRHYCPFICGFPHRGMTQATPLWESLATRLLRQVQEEYSTGDDSGGGVERTPVSRTEILKMLQSGLSSKKPLSKISGDID